MRPGLIPNTMIPYTTVFAAQTAPTPSTAMGSAGCYLGGHRVVIGGDVITYADKDIPEHAGLVFGVTKGASSTGEMAHVQIHGMMTEPSWNWTPGPVFLGNNGMLTQDLPTTGFTLQVGSATSPQTLFINIQTPVEN